jgi:hypothetical protein
MDGLTKAWILLIVLSSITTVLATFSGDWGGGFVAAILILSGWKARLILNKYLGLENSGFWQRGFNTFIGMFLILVLGLYFLPTVL